MERLRFRLLAIDDDSKVLDAYSSLFQREENWINAISALSGQPSTALDDEEFEFDLECQLSGQRGVEALKRAQDEQDPFSVIFLDMRMPNGWDGLETAKEVRKLDQSVRIVLVSAYTDYSLKEIRSEIGARFVFHSKPWNDEELVQLTRLLVSDWAYEAELRETQLQLKRATEEAVQANEAKDQFLASMSHELRTPLTSMLGYGELLEDSGLVAEQRQLLNTIQVSGRTLLYLLNDILDLSKIKAGKFEVDQIEFDLQQTLQEVEQIFAVRAQQQEIDFSLNYVSSEDALSHMLIGDGKRIGQILINLVSNALKFTKDGFVRLTVKSADGLLHFLVEDSGIGMSSTVVKRLFQPFEQADRSISGRFGGTGLGLHISQTLAHLMGGEVLVESREGIGSKFELVVPVTVGKVKAQLSMQEIAEEESAQLEGKVLIAEDTPELQILIQRMIEPLGVEVEVAGNGEQALEMATEKSYQLILMDMQMPIMDGIEATKKLRLESVTTPIVALTANVMQHQRDEFEAAGCDGFLSKPIQKNVLFSVLKSYLETRKEEPAVVSPIEMDDELHQLFQQRVSEMIAEISAARQADDLTRLKEIIHTIKGSIGSFGYQAISQQAESVEQQIEKGDRAEADATLDLLLQQLANILSV